MKKNTTVAPVILRFQKSRTSGLSVMACSYATNADRHEVERHDIVELRSRRLPVRDSWQHLWANLKAGTEYLNMRSVMYTHILSKTAINSAAPASAILWYMLWEVETEDCKSCTYN